MGKNIIGKKISKHLQYNLWTDGTVHHDWETAIQEYLTSQLGMTFTDPKHTIAERNTILTAMLELGFAQSNHTILSLVLNKLEKSREKNNLPQTSFREQYVRGEIVPAPEGEYAPTEQRYLELKEERRALRSNWVVKTPHKIEPPSSTTMLSAYGGLKLEVNNTDFLFILDAVTDGENVFLYLPTPDKTYVRHYSWWHLPSAGTEHYPVTWVVEIPAQ